MKVLLVEDEPHVASSVKLGLRAEGFVVVDVATGTEGLWQATENHFDVVVLDIMLPEMSGYEVLRRMRALSVWTPVLMLTAKDGEYDQADAFDLGADDHLVKPFSFVVLVARLRALLRRGAPQRPTVMEVGDLTPDPARHTVERSSTAIELSSREFALLDYLMRNKDAVCAKSDILDNVWDPNFTGPDNIVEVYVGYLRRKIDIPFGTNTIETIRGVGYRLTFGVAGSRTVTTVSPPSRSPIDTSPRCADHGVIESPDHTVIRFTLLSASGMRLVNTVVTHAASQSYQPIGFETDGLHGRVATGLTGFRDQCRSGCTRLWRSSSIPTRATAVFRCGRGGRPNYWSPAGRENRSSPAGTVDASSGGR